MAKKYRVAVIAGEGVGREVVPEGIAVLETAARRYGFELEWTEFDWSCETYAKTGRMMPEDGLARVRPYDSIFLGAVGYPGVPDHISLWGLLIPFRREDRKSTRLNSSHQIISYAVFCLKKKKQETGCPLCVQKEIH